MAATTVIELPEFDTGLYEGYDFLISSGGALLTLKLAEMENFSIRFDRVRWHQFTALPNCTTEMIQDAYFRLVEYKESPNVGMFIRGDKLGGAAYSKLSHYRIFLDETGCHEVYAESATAL
nr:hypothetical protein [uncultured Undibacterium sp.]